MRFEVRDPLSTFENKTKEIKRKQRLNTIFIAPIFPGKAVTVTLSLVCIYNGRAVFLSFFLFFFFFEQGKRAITSTPSGSEQSLDEHNPCGCVTPRNYVSSRWSWTGKGTSMTQIHYI